MGVQLYVMTGIVNPAAKIAYVSFAIMAMHIDINKECGLDPVSIANIDDLLHSKGSVGKIGVVMIAKRQYVPAHAKGFRVDRHNKSWSHEFKFIVDKAGDCLVPVRPGRLPITPNSTFRSTSQL